MKGRSEYLRGALFTIRGIFISSHRWFIYLDSPPRVCFQFGGRSASKHYGTGVYLNVRIVKVCGIESGQLMSGKGDFA